MIGALLSIVLVTAAPSSGVDSLEQAKPIAAWTSASATYGVCRDPLNNDLLLTRDADGVPRLFHADNVHENPRQFVMRQNGDGRGLAYVTMADNGDGFGVTYTMGTRQPHATIVRVYRTADTITVGEPIQSIVGEHYSSCPAISRDGQMMVFVTDRPGGMGRTDLWFVERQLDGSFGAPQHCGNAVNSPYSESTPTLLASDTLLFSSNGFGGQGGMDVFVSVFRDGIWQEPLPVEQLNSAFDDTDALRLQNGTFLLCRTSAQNSEHSQMWLVEPTP